jgi:hypothetical protein
MITARNATDAHAQDFMVYDELRLPILKHSHSVLSHYTPLEILDGFSLSLVPVAVQ